jgi:mono/diheme cytochrome c family protein
LIVRFVTSPGLILLWFSGVGAGLLSVGIGALVVIEGGLFNATASTPHSPAVALAAHTAFIRSVEVRARAIEPPSRFTPAEVTAGFRDYDVSCAACHGGPGIPRANWAAGITPTPPFLEDTAQRWRPRELYWIVGQGVKMTAMPAWGEVRSNGQVWDLVAFLEALPYLTKEDYLKLRAAAQKASAPNAMPGSGEPVGSQSAPPSPGG